MRTSPHAVSLCLSRLKTNKKNEQFANDVVAHCVRKPVYPATGGFNDKERFTLSCVVRQYTLQQHSASPVEYSGVASGSL